MGELWIDRRNGVVILNGGAFGREGVRILSTGSSELSHDELIRQWRLQKWDGRGWILAITAHVKNVRWVTWQCERCGKWDYDVGTNRPVVVPNKRVCRYCVTAEEAQEMRQMFGKLERFPQVKHDFIMLLMRETVLEFARLCGATAVVHHWGSLNTPPEELQWLGVTKWSHIGLRMPYEDYERVIVLREWRSRHYHHLPRLLRYREGSAMDGVALLCGNWFRCKTTTSISRTSALHAVRVGEKYILKLELESRLPQFREICEVVRVRIPREYGERLLGELDGIPENTAIKRLKSMIMKRIGEE